MKKDNSNKLKLDTKKLKEEIPTKLNISFENVIKTTVTTPLKNSKVNKNKL